MKEIKCKSINGRPYGHVPGNHYHDVEVSVTRSRHGIWTVTVTEKWGSAQGYDEKHGRRRVVIKDENLRSACDRVRKSATGAGISTEYLEQSLTQASATTARRCG
jgi:hypothetical protein